MRTLNLYILFIIVSWGSPLYSQGVELTFKTSLNISADEIFESRIYSLISREIRKINDVKIVDDEDSNYEINVLCIETSTRDDIRTGYVAAVTVTSPRHGDSIIETIALYESINNGVSVGGDEIKLDSTAIGRLIRLYFEEAVRIEYQILLVDSDLENLANRIVGEVDYNVFEESRKYLNGIQGEHR